MKLVLELDTKDPTDIAYAASVVEGLLATIPGRNPNPRPAAPVAQEAKALMDWPTKAPENKVITAAPERSAPTSQELSESIDKAAESVAEPAEAKPAKPKKEKPPVTKTITIDSVRAIMVEKAKKGPEEMARQRGILSSMGFGKLSDVPPEKLIELKEKVEAE